MSNILEFDSNHVNNILDVLLYNYYDDFSKKEIILLPYLVNYAKENFKLEFNNKLSTTLYLLTYTDYRPLTSDIIIKIDEQDILDSLKYKNKEVIDNVIRFSDTCDKYGTELTSTLLTENFENAYNFINEDIDIYRKLFDEYIAFARVRPIDNGIFTFYSHLFISELAHHDSDVYDRLMFENRLK